MTFKVAVDAGHGFNTPGKRTPDGEREWSFNDKVVRAFIREMAKYEGVVVRRFDDPTGKTDIPLTSRTNSANQWRADIFVSFHHNASTGRWGSHTGTETYYWKTSKQGRQLAQKLQDANVKAYGLRDRGLKTANLHITRETRMPAALVEGAFMDSTIDIKKMRDDKVLENAGKYSAQAVADYAGLTRKKTVSSSPAIKPNPKIRTGGLNPENLAKVSAYLTDKGWYWTTIGSKGNNPKARTGGLNEAMRKEFGDWLDSQGMWWTIER